MISTQNGIIALPEICINGTYGAICDSGWDERDARVACNQLGFPASLGARELLLTSFINKTRGTC